MKRILPLISIVFVIVALGVAWMLLKKETPEFAVTNFEECVAAGNPVMESYPRGCRAGDQTFIEEVGSIPPSTCTKDTDCPSNFACMQTCGPPVVRYPDDTPPQYMCQPKGYIQNCPICLAEHTVIDTPHGAVAIENFQQGAPIWTVTSSGTRVLGIVTQISKVAVPPNHKMVKLMLEDGRTLFVSPGHPTIDERTVGDLAVGDEYGGSQVISIDRNSYAEGYTYDILPSGETGYYFANGILVGSTLH